MATLMFGILAAAAVLVGLAALAGDEIGAEEGCRSAVGIGIIVIAGIALVVVLMANGRL